MDRRHSALRAPAAMTWLERRVEPRRHSILLAFNRD
jgi:hypothetical protein